MILKIKYYHVLFINYIISYVFLHVTIYYFYYCEWIRDGQHDPYRPKKYEWCLRTYFRHIKKACSKPNFYPPNVLMFILKS